MISHHVDARNTTQVLYKSYNALNCDALSQSLILSIFFHHVTQEIRPGWENLRPLREKVESASFSICARDQHEAHPELCAFFLVPEKHRRSHF